MIRVLIADDQELIRSALGTVVDLQDDLELVGSVASGEEAARTCLERTVDVVLMDIRMGDLDGIAASREIRRHRPDTRILILTTFDLDENLFRALDAGAGGFLTKDTPGVEIVAGIREVYAGRSVVSPRATRSLIDRVSRPRSDQHTGLKITFSTREREVLGLLARGFSNAEIGRELYVAESTVKTHVGSLIRKLGVRDRLHVVVWAYQNDVL